MSHGDDPLSSLIRGFGWATGRRLAYQLPLPLALVVIVLWHYLMRAG